MSYHVIGFNALSIMRRRGGKWAAYENKAMDSSDYGHMQMLKYGEGCTFETPPEKYPADTLYGMGWRYRFIGEVNLKTGRTGNVDDDYVQRQIYEMRKDKLFVWEHRAKHYYKFTEHRKGEFTLKDIGYLMHLDWALCDNTDVRRSFEALMQVASSWPHRRGEI